MAFNLDFLRKNLIIIVIVLLALNIVSNAISIFTKNKNDDNKLVELNLKYNIAISDLKNQKHISDTLIHKSNITVYNVIHDTVIIGNIKNKYEKAKFDNRELSPDEQLRFSAEWLSKENSSK